MDRTQEMALMFKALGDPTRLRIFEFLRARCCAVAIEDEGDVRPVTGATVGEVCCSITGIDKITSTISFHLKELRLSGLVDVEKNGKFSVCRVNRDAVERLGAYLNETECCGAVEDCVK